MAAAGNQSQTPPSHFRRPRSMRTARRWLNKWIARTRRRHDGVGRVLSRCTAGHQLQQRTDSDTLPDISRTRSFHVSFALSSQPTKTGNQAYIMPIMAVSQVSGDHLLVFSCQNVCTVFYTATVPQPDIVSSAKLHCLLINLFYRGTKV